MLKYAVVTAIGAAVVVVGIVRHDTRVFAVNAGIVIYPSGIAVVQVPYSRDGGAGMITVTVGTQTVVSGTPAVAVKYSSDNYYFRPSGALGTQARVSMAYDSGGAVQTVERTVNILRVRAGAASAVPDESAPDAAAQAAVALAKRHDADDKLPADPQTVAAELKGDMSWSATGGVTPEQYVVGMNLWATKKSLPMHTEKISGKPDTILGSISQTLDRGGTAQLYLQFKHAGRPAGSRMVNVTRVTRTGSDVFIGIHDSAGPGGTDMYRVRDGTLIDYAFSDDTAVIGWGFIETWNNK